MRSQAGSCSSAGTRSEGVLEGFGRGRACVKIASEQELIAKINRLQQVEGEHLKYEVSTEMQELPTEPSGAGVERGRAISEQRVGCAAPAVFPGMGLNGRLPPRHSGEDGLGHKAPGGQM